MMKAIKTIEASVLALLVLLSGFAAGTEARVTRIHVESRNTLDFASFGGTGPYLKIKGTFEGEVDPDDRRSRVIADIDLAPVTDEGMVRYSSEFFILKPVAPGKGNGRLFYPFGNRGGKRFLQWFNDAEHSNDPDREEHFGHGFLMRQGYSIALSGYSTRVRSGPDILSADLPVARNPDGSTITGKVITENIPEAGDETTLRLPYAASSTDAANGVLTVKETGDGEPVPVEGWHYLDERTIEFPGPARTWWVYEFIYTARDPVVMGLGHAATRDFIAFLRHAEADAAGNPNPLASPSGIEAVYSWGRSNGGRTQRDFLRWGFNEDEQGRTVIDGMLPYGTGSGGHVWFNRRFAQPMASSRKHRRFYAPEHEFPHTFPVIDDPLTGETDGILRRCLATDTCPRVFNIDGANEYWNKASSLNHTDAQGNDLDSDALAPNVRIYAIAAIEHNTTHDQTAPEVLPECQQMTNPLYNGPVFRALLVAMDRWVSSGEAPPPDIVPTKQDGTLVPPEALEFPAIPPLDYAGWPALPRFVYTPETLFTYAPLDLSVVPYRRLPGPEYTVQIAQVDADGNEVAGIRLPGLAAPLGTHLGWSVLKPGAGFPDTCGQHGSFIPFARTRVERLAAGDPRPSLEERYGNEAAFADRIEAAANRLVKQGFLLQEDKTRIVRRAREYGFDFWRHPLPY